MIESREARRAVQDSLPLLQEAARITIFEACGPDEEKSALADGCYATTTQFLRELPEAMRQQASIRDYH